MCRADKRETWMRVRGLSGCEVCFFSPKLTCYVWWTGTIHHNQRLGGRLGVHHHHHDIVQRKRIAGLTGL